MCLRIFPELKTIFIHIPKTGGRTIARYLARSAGSPESKFWGEIPADYKSFYKFAFTRNPFSRFISSWAYCTEKGWCPQMPPASFLTFALDNDLPAVPAISHASNQELCKHHTAPQTSPEFLLHQADEVFRFEEFPSAVNQLSERFGFAPDDLHLNRSPHRDFRNYYDADLIRQVRRHFAQDFEALGYSRNLP